MYLLLWHKENGNLAFAKAMHKAGFNAWRIPVEPFWNQVKDLQIDVEDKQKMTANSMYDFYLSLKRLGFKFFLIDAGWGLGSFDGNYFYERIYDKFEGKQDVLYDWGECYEDCVETKKMTIEQYWKVFEQRHDLMGEQLTVGATARNKDKLGATSLTSYINQEKYWRSSDKLAWIFGQYAYHNLLGSLDYESKARKIKELKIDVVGLYQGNPSNWSAVGWENKIADMFGLREKFEEKLRTKFINFFRG